MKCLLPNEKEINLICIGKDVYEWVKKLLIEKKDLNFQYFAYCFPHYSGANCAKVSGSNESDKFYPTVIKNKIKEYGLDLLY